LRRELDFFLAPLDRDLDDEEARDDVARDVRFVRLPVVRRELDFFAADCRDVDFFALDLLVLDFFALDLRPLDLAAMNSSPLEAFKVRR
jgi:hypothetical protein